jgi:hypothetical protein
MALLMDQWRTLLQLLQDLLRLRGPSRLRLHQLLKTRLNIILVKVLIDIHNFVIILEFPKSVSEIVCLEHILHLGRGPFSFFFDFLFFEGHLFDISIDFLATVLDCGHLSFIDDFIQ